MKPFVKEKHGETSEMLDRMEFISMIPLLIHTILLMIFSACGKKKEMTKEEIKELSRVIANDINTAYDLRKVRFEGVPLGVPIQKRRGKMEISFPNVTIPAEITSDVLIQAFDKLPNRPQGVTLLRVEGLPGSRLTCFFEVEQGKTP